MITNEPFPKPIITHNMMTCRRQQHVLSEDQQWVCAAGGDTEEEHSDWGEVFSLSLVSNTLQSSLNNIPVINTFNFLF